MIDPPATTSLTPGRAWMRRMARVATRLHQVWCRTDGRVETLFVIGAPTLVSGWHGGQNRYGKMVCKLTNFLTGLTKNGWCHEVVCLETGCRSFMNEVFFASSELKQPSVFARLA